MAFWVDRKSISHHSGSKFSSVKWIRRIMAMQQKKKTIERESERETKKRVNVKVEKGKYFSN